MIKTVSLWSPTAARDFTQSLKETGFAVVTGHTISPELLDWAYEDWASYFANDDKNKDLFDKATHAGYFPFRSENAKDSPAKDLKEFFHYYDGQVLPEQCSTSTICLRASLVQLAEQLLGFIQDETDPSVCSLFSIPLPKMIEGSKSTLFRILHYPPLDASHEPGAVRAAAHEDINLITLLPAATQPGLQVKDSDGKWVDVPCDPGSIIVNVGDMLEMASGGFYKSTSHRVVNPLGEESLKSRYSMPLFLHPRPDVMLTADLNAEQALMKRLKELGLI